MKESEEKDSSLNINNTPLIDNNLIEMSLLNPINGDSGSDEDEEEEKDKVEQLKSDRINTILPRHKAIPKQRSGSLTNEGQSDEEEEEKKEPWNLIPVNFFSFSLIFYVLVFLILFLCSFNFSFLTLPYVVITIILCILSNLSENHRFYDVLYILRILMFPFTCIYSLGVLLFKLYMFSKVYDDDLYPKENEEFLLNMGIFYYLENKNTFYLIKSIGPESILFIYSLFFSLLLFISQLNCPSEFPICFDIENKYREKTPKTIRRHVKFTYLMLMIFSYFNPSITTFTYLLMFQICLGFLANDNKAYITKKFCIIQIIIVFIFIIYSIHIILNNLLQINFFQMNYLLDGSEPDKEKTCKNANNIWINIGINCTYNINNFELIYQYIGYAFNILSFISMEKVIRIVANGNLVTNDDYYKDYDDKIFFDETDEVSWIIRKIKNLFVFIITFLEGRNFISHFCRICAIIHINYCQNFYSLVVFLWLFFSFLCNNIQSTKNLCIFCIIPVLIISSFCYNLSNFNIFDIGDATSNKDFYTFFGLKKLNKYFFLSFISCHLFFLLIITFVSSLEDKVNKIDLKILPTSSKEEEEEIIGHTGTLSNISLLNVNSLIGVNKKKKSKKKVNIEEKNFEDKFKDLLQKKINKDDNKDKKDKNKDENLTIINILIKKILIHMNKINLILVYLVAVSSINIIHLLLVLIFILNVVSSIWNSKVNSKNLERGIKDESKIKYYATKITLVVIQLCFLFEFFIDLYKCFFLSDEEKKKEKKDIIEIFKFILYFKEKVDENSCETLLFVIAYFYYFEYQIFLIKNRKTQHKDLEDLLNNKNISFYSYFKSTLKYTFFIYDYIINIINHIFLWFYTFILIFFLSYYELNIFFAVQLLLLLISIYCLLVKIQSNVNDNNLIYNRKNSTKDIFVTYIFLIASIANTIVVYLYQFICHDYWYNKIKDTFLVNKELQYIGLKKYSGYLQLKLLPFFVINFASILFLNELDNFQKRVEKEDKFLKSNFSMNNNISNDNKSKQNLNDKDLDYIEKFEKCKDEINNIKMKLFGINIVLIITKIYWIFLFFMICTLFNSYYFSLSMAIYIIIFGLAFIRMFHQILEYRNINYISKNSKEISEESLEIENRIKINRYHREISFRFLVAYSFLIYFLYYIYGIYDISISYCSPNIWIGCDNKDNIVDENYDINNDLKDDTIGLIKSLSFIFGVYYNTKKERILWVGWVHLFLCLLFCFDVYIQKIENYFNAIKTRKITEEDEKTLDLIWLRQKSLESEVDSLIFPNKANEKNENKQNEIIGTLRESIGKRISEDLSSVIKIFYLYKIKEKRDKEKKKVMQSIRYIFEEIIILVLVIGGIRKANIWSVIYILFVFFVIFTNRSMNKFYYFYCFDIIGIIIQIFLFVTNIEPSILPKEVNEVIYSLTKKHLNIPWVNKKNHIILSFIFGVGVDKEQINTIYYDFFLIVLIYIYLENFTYKIYTESNSTDRLIMPFVKGNLLYDAMIDNPSLKNRDIDISRKDFSEIKSVIKKNTFIESVIAIRYDDFLIALKKLKIVKDDHRKIDSIKEKKINGDEMAVQRQKLLIKLNAKTQQIFNLFEFVKIIIYLSSHNFILIINILISMMIPGIISLVYIIFFIIFLAKSNSLIQGKRYYYPHFTKYIRLILLIDISFQIACQYSMKEGFYSQILEILGVKKLIIFNNDEVEENEESFDYLLAKAFSFFFISLQILIYSSVDFIEYYFIYLLTLRVNEYKMAKINAFKFNNERMDVMAKSLSLKEDAFNTMNELQCLLEDWRSIFAKRKKKLSIKRNTKYKLKEEEISNLINEEEAKQTIKDWIMDKFLINLYVYIHKYSSPYQTLGNNEMYELEKNIIQGETKPITYIEFLIDFYLDALSPFNLTEQGLSIVESIINGSMEERRQEIEKIKKNRELEKEKRVKENENLKKKCQELMENVKRIDSIIEKLEQEIKNDSEGNFGSVNDVDRNENGSFNLDFRNLIVEEKKEDVKPEEIGEKGEKNDFLIESYDSDLSKADKNKLLSNYQKAKKIILEEEKKIQRKIWKYEDICEREEKHNKNKYLDDEMEVDGAKREINKIDLKDEKFLKFEILKKKSILFTRYLKNSFIFSCILLDLKSCLAYNFHWFCYILMIINHMYSASLISFFYPITIFCYALLEFPRPKKRYWKICLYYTFLILFIKLIFTLDLYTLFMDKDQFKEFLDTLDNYRIGFHYCELTMGKEFFSYIILDILVIVSLMIYINILLINGTYNKRELEIESIYSAMERVAISNCLDIKDDEIKDFNKEFLSSSGVTGYKRIESLSKIKDESGKHRRKGRVSLMDGFLQKKMIKTEIKNQKEKNEKTEKEEENKEINKSYFQRLFPRNRNEKPGDEYYPIYTTALFILLAYILLFFNYMVKDENYGSLSLDVQQFNGLMVIYFIFHVVILILDRAILLFQNSSNIRYKYYLYNKKDFNDLGDLLNFRKKSKDDKREYFKKNLTAVEDKLIELYPKKKRWSNHSLIIPIQYLSDLREEYFVSFKQIEDFNKPLFFKYILYIFIVIFVHFITFVYFPMKGNINSGNEVFCIEQGKCNDFNSNIALIFFYIFYLFYLIPSALQIKYGFNDMKKKSILKRSPSDLNNLLVTIYQQIPFLNEIKNILDWTLTSTSLDLGQWIQFESIYEAIFSTYSDDRDEENVIGQKIDKMRKAQKGGVLSFILITALIFPLVMFSSINPTNIINSVYDGKLKVDLSFTYQDNEVKKYTLFENNRPESITEITDEIFKEFNYTLSVKTRSFPKQQIQTIKFYETSDTNWDLVLPHIQTIVNELNISNPENTVNSINLIIQTQFTRPLPAEAQIVTDEITANIYNRDQDSDSEGAQKAFNLSNAFTNCEDTYINFYDIYTPSRKLSSSTDPIIIEDIKHFYPLGIQLGFQGCDNSSGKNNFLQSYFTLKSLKNKKDENNTKIHDEAMTFHIFSETISPTTSSYSVYAFYTAVILVFGEYVRDFCSGEPEKVILNEMPDPRKMVDLCEGITIARNSREFRMEKKLYFILIELLREPTYLKEITKSSVERFEEREENAKFVTTDEID